MKANISNLGWQSDWDGKDVGFPEIDVVGLYSSSMLQADFYIDMDTMEVLQITMWEEDEDE